MANLFDGYLLEAAIGVAAPLVSAAVGVAAHAPSRARFVASLGRGLARTALIWLPALGVFLSSLGPVALHEGLEGTVARGSFHVDGSRGGREPDIQHVLLVDRTGGGQSEVAVSRAAWMQCRPGQAFEKAPWSWTIRCGEASFFNLGGFWVLAVAALLLALAPGGGTFLLARSEEREA